MFLTTRPVFFGIVLWHCSTALFYGIVLGHCSVALVGIRSHCVTLCLIASRPVALYVLFVPVLQLFVLFIPTNVFAALFSSPKRWFCSPIFTESNYLRNYNGILRMESLYGRKDWTAQDWCNIYYAGDTYYRGTCVCPSEKQSLAYTLKIQFTLNVILRNVELIISCWGKIMLKRSHVTVTRQGDVTAWRNKAVRRGHNSLNIFCGQPGLQVHHHESGPRS